MILVSDSGPIITLARASKLHLLQDLFSQVLIPNGVYEELVLKGKGKAGAEEVRHLILKQMCYVSVGWADIVIIIESNSVSIHLVFLHQLQ